MGNVTTMEYDSKGNLIQIQNPKSQITKINYNSYGQPTSVTDALNNTSTFEYDQFGNLIKTTDPLGNSAQMTYDYIGRLIKATDARGDTIEYSYDNLNRITEVLDDLDNKTKFTYDANGNLLTVTDAKNQIITYTYNVKDKVASMTDQLAKTETYSYDLNDNLTSITDRKGQKTDYTYDYLDRITKASYSDASYTDYTYDAVSRLTYINDSASGAIEYSYSNTGCSSGCSGGATDKVMQEITSLGSISYEYDAIGRRTKMTVAGQPSVNYSYDANSRLTYIVGAGLAPAQMSYDALGRRTALSLPNGITTNYSYDNASHLLNIESLNPLNAILEKIGYSYDANGNRMSMDRQNVSVKLPSPVSNISYNSANQLLTFNDKNISYDANGNMETITNTCGTTTYTWDARNRLSRINGFNTDCSSLSASFRYDALGRRIEKTVNGKTIDYLYDGIDIVQEIEDGRVSANYIRTLNIDEPLARIERNGTVRYYQQDALGSVIALTDETGTIKTQYIYDPFGNTGITGEANDNPFQYTGRENDNTGLYYYRARYYSPELQRWVSDDPIRFRDGMNFFVYVKNRPTVYKDPLGLETTYWCVRLYFTESFMCHSIDDSCPPKIKDLGIFTIKNAPCIFNCYFTEEEWNAGRQRGATDEGVL
ncbi:MAG: RHS repeat protein [Nitrospirae bacterium]|nr:RHS repeat protein [Nitrospirota bacterium]